MFLWSVWPAIFIVINSQTENLSEDCDKNVYFDFSTTLVLIFSEYTYCHERTSVFLQCQTSSKSDSEQHTMAKVPI
jgi:hypothetical protein